MRWGFRWGRSLSFEPFGGVRKGIPILLMPIGWLGFAHGARSAREASEARDGKRANERAKWDGEEREINKAPARCGVGAHASGAHDATRWRAKLSARKGMARRFPR